MSSNSYRELIVRAWDRNHLLSALIELTYRCNWDCAFCYNDLSLRGTPMSTEQHLALLDDLRAMQVLNLILTGGEPLAHPDFMTIAVRARELEFAIRLKSNGHALRGRLAQRLAAEVDPQIIEVSLHGATAPTHDRQTRVAGSFDRLLENIDEMRELGLRVKVNTTLTRWNEHEIEEMFALTDRLGVPFQVDPEVTPRDDGDLEPLSLAASPEAMVRLFELQRARAGAHAVAAIRREGPGTPYAESPGDGSGEQADSEKHCGAGSSVIAVDPYGNVYPCVQWRQACGNLHERSIAEIWSGAGMHSVRETTRDVKQWLARDHADRAYGYCPGAAHSNTGSPRELYPAAESRDATVRRVSLPILR